MYIVIIIVFPLLKLSESTLNFITQAFLDFSQKYELIKDRQVLWREEYPFNNGSSRKIFVFYY